MTSPSQEEYNDLHRAIAEKLRPIREEQWVEAISDDDWKQIAVVVVDSVLGGADQEWSQVDEPPPPFDANDAKRIAALQKASRQLVERLDDIRRNPTTKAAVDFEMPSFSDVESRVRVVLQHMDFVGSALLARSRRPRGAPRKIYQLRMIKGIAAILRPKFRSRTELSGFVEALVERLGVIAKSKRIQNILATPIKSKTR